MKNARSASRSRLPAGRPPGLPAGPDDAAMESLRELLSRLPVGVYRTTPDGRILQANPALARMLGYSQAQLKRKNVADLYRRKNDRKRSLQAYAEGAEYTEFELKRRDGRVICGRDHSKPKRDGKGRIVHFDGILVDITEERWMAERLRRAYARLRAINLERKEMIKKLESLSITDDLTGLYNRRGFYMFVQQYLSLAARKKGPAFLLYLDLDNLKRINDVFGHHVGDQAIIRTSELLKSSFRSSDVKSRMGGDEFAVFPIDATVEGIDIIMARFRKNVEDANAAAGAVFEISFSVGLAAFDPERPSTLDELLLRADAMMYEEKRKKELR